MSRFHDAIQSCPEHPQYVIQLRDRHPLSTFLVAVETITPEGRAFNQLLMATELVFYKVFA
ncbi:hypothetical protein H6F86_13685 [Phormidium sp. FACHB-592]|uniref:Uncharacterized protein n=1 Tax=Stenomitos frigidus AS-A4 TaxID=2933935 RepID=A0ABV0KPD3_9CYAN|nr:hypothetical protein [Phormidium sp. FACHB-592]MBD2074926.1 hypothetical protein [Phormidium sp. FACHB-592]